MNIKPRLWPSILCFIAASLVWYLLGEYDPGKMATLILVGAGGLYGLNWLFHEYNARRAEWIKSNDLEHVHNTDKVAMFAAAGKLNTEQIAALNNLGVRRILVPGQHGEPAELYVELGDRRIRSSFIQTFILAGVGEYLAPIRTWGEGSNERLDAEALTAYFIEFRFAEPAKGPRSAKWLDRAGGLRSIGLEEE